MEIRILIGLLLCLLFQSVLLLDGPALIEATLGTQEQPYALSTLAILGLGVVEALLVVLYFVTERSALAGAIADHVGTIERAIWMLFSPHPERRASAAEAFRGEEATRYWIYRNGLWRALKFLSIATVFGLMSVAAGGSVLLEFARAVL